MDNTSFVNAACNNYGIQGAWYCFQDSVSTTSAPNCSQPNVAPTNIPFNATGGGECINGTVPAGTSGFGAAIGVELNNAGGAAAKGVFNATQASIVGFEITITGTVGATGDGVGLRVSFTTAATTAGPQPFVDVPGPGTYQVLFANAVAPLNIGGTGVKLNAASIADVQVFVPQQPNIAVPFNFCITEMKPLLAAPAIPGACGAGVALGNLVCGVQDIIGGVGNYAVQNNISPIGIECIQALRGGATCAGFNVSFNNFGAGGNAPSSYPSIIYGWQHGAFYGGLTAARRLSGITGTVTTSWTFTPPSSNYDAAYDIWLHPTATNPANAGGGVELMVWLNWSGKQPIGAPKAGNAGAPGSKAVGTAPGVWEVWTGQGGDGTNTWQVLSYRRPAGSTQSSITSLDLMQFFTDAATEGVGLNNTWNLLGVQAGFEVWGPNQGGTAGTSSFSVTVP
jgi:hypothetical protein